MLFCSANGRATTSPDRRKTYCSMICGFTNVIRRRPCLCLQVLSELNFIRYCRNFHPIMPLSPWSVQQLT